MNQPSLLVHVVEASYACVVGAYRYQSESQYWIHNPWPMTFLDWECCHGSPVTVAYVPLNILQLLANKCSWLPVYYDVALWPEGIKGQFLPKLEVENHDTRKGIKLQAWPGVVVTQKGHAPTRSLKNTYSRNWSFRFFCKWTGVRSHWQLPTEAMDVLVSTFLLEKHLEHVEAGYGHKIMGVGDRPWPSGVGTNVLWGVTPEFRCPNVSREGNIYLGIVIKERH